jgi:hypothetical protein
MSQDKFIGIFDRIDRFFQRLETYIGVIPTTDMTDMTVGIMVGVLTVLTITTKEVNADN